MPLPIKTVSDQERNSEKNNYNVDMSFLFSKPSDRKKITASNRDAEALMKIWSEAKSKGNNVYDLENCCVDKRDFMRLKVNGFVEGSSDSFRITSRGKKIITVMTLGESNRFLKSKKEKSYTEILASTKTNKGNYRIANKENKSCRVTSKNGSFSLTKEAWEKMGREAKWL